MHDATILDLGLDPRYAQLSGHAQTSPAGRRKLLVILAAAAAILLCAGAAAPGILSGLGLGFGTGENAIRISLSEQRDLATMTVEDKSQILAKGLDAVKRNGEIPVSALPVETVSALKFGMIDGSSYATALRCLTQAVYYEAASEPLQGRRAVAQVVLNRMRHPAYPNSVCGVVYQGIERGWGCQFSFVCDGALLRSPSAKLWAEAHGIAQAALGGFVEASVGTATHYHADYVLPKWAFRLGKIEQLGRHIFYRFNGNMGRSVAFTDRYSGVERIPMINFAALAAKVGPEQALVGDAMLVAGLTVAPEITDRHAPADVGGRLDVTKTWRLAIPDPVSASSRYRETLAKGGAAPALKVGESAGLANAGPVNAPLPQ